MELIEGNAVIDILRGALNLADSRVVNHADHVAYMLYKMLECEGKYTKEQRDRFFLIGLLHDIGAYKTDEIDRMLTYDCKNVWGHSIYGYLYLRYLSPLDQYGNILLYHHLDYNKFGMIEYAWKDISMYINVVDRVDIILRKNNGRFAKSYLEKGRQKKYSGDALDLFYAADSKYHLIEKLINNQCNKELDEIINNVWIPEQDRLGYLRMLVFAIDFRNEDTVLRNVGTSVLAMRIGRDMGLDERQLADLHAASLIYDLGMLAIPQNIIEAPRQLTEYEQSIVRTHVRIGENIIQGRLGPDIVKTAAAHHEKLDGSGYPQGLQGSQITMPQRILTVSDIVVALGTRKNYKGILSRAEILQTITYEAKTGKLCPDVVNCISGNYDQIEAHSKESSRKALENYLAIKEQYGAIIQKFERFN